MEHRDEVRNQIDGAECVGHHEEAQQLHGSGRFRIPAGEPQGDRIALDAPRPVAKTVCQVPDLAGSFRSAHGRKLSFMKKTLTMIMKLIMVK